ncbi:glycosyltransferase [Achromobacter aloeverae]|uniref:Glycosyltransferase family 1 protein n=1 Tax=Achromobacter aloeverae TaxID=1750518 RepID=A0A4Q1HGN2_9BURK|nr:glycosyltransferase [Achromobacter aloeverae]RXN86299.1 glycosyltransferase family 1 protein [Achromobacter aloeverae]
MKIALISEHASPLAMAGGVDSGGQNIYVGKVAEYCARAGHHVDVFTRQEDVLAPRIVQWRPGVRIVHVPAGPPRVVPKEELLPYMGEFSRYLRQWFHGQLLHGHGYDVVHANFFMSAMAAQPVAQSLGIPLVVTFHALGRVRRLYQGDADRFPDSRFDIEEDIVRHADRIIAECPQDRRDLLDLYHADPRRLATVPCGYEPKEMTPQDRLAARAQLGWPAEAFTILQLGRMVPRKGVEDVVLAVARLRERHGVHARLCVVGGNSDTPCEVLTPEIGRLRKLAHEAGVADQVEFIGRRDRSKLRTYYSAADVFVTTPWYEPFGITPLEAMACGRPVIGSDTGGIRYSVVHGETGFLVPTRNPAAVADQLAVLARDSGLARRMGEAGLRRARRRFTWRHVAEQLLAVYADLVPSSATNATLSTARERAPAARRERVPA